MKTQITIDTPDAIREKLGALLDKEHPTRPAGLVTRKELKTEVGQWVLDIANGFLIRRDAAPGTQGVTRETLRSAVAIANINYETKVELWRIVEELEKQQ